MKLCLCFHCLCETYDRIPDYSRELYVSLPEMREMIEQLLDRGYRFAAPDDSGDNTVTVTFDDGYYNNTLFKDIAADYNIPFVVFVSTYYLETGEEFPWLGNGGKNYHQMHDFDYYTWHEKPTPASEGEAPNESARPITFKELDEMRQTGLMEIGCHGHYHQPLSSDYEKYLVQERDLGLAALQDQIGVKPRYFALANGIYTKKVIRDLLTDFDRVFTIEGRSFGRRDRVIHRLTMVTPTLGNSLIEQIGRHLKPLRRLRRAIRTYGRLGP